MEIWNSVFICLCKCYTNHLYQYKSTLCSQSLLLPFFWLVILIIIYTFVSEVYRLKWKKKCLFLKRVPTASSFNKQIKFKTFKWILHFKNPEISRMIKLKNCARYFEWLLHRKWCKYLPLMIYARNLFLLLFLSTICILSMKISWVFFLSSISIVHLTHYICVFIKNRGGNNNVRQAIELTYYKVYMYI